MDALVLCGSFTLFMLVGMPVAYALVATERLLDEDDIAAIEQLLTEPPGKE